MNGRSSCMTNGVHRLFEHPMPAALRRLAGVTCQPGFSSRQLLESRFEERFEVFTPGVVICRQLRDLSPVNDYAFRVLLHEAVPFGEELQQPFGASRVGNGIADER